MAIIHVLLVSILLNGLTHSLNSVSRTSINKFRSALFQTTISAECTWSPQDLTKNVPGFPPIPENDYIRKYQKNPELWPVEFFLIVYRHFEGKTQILVRPSANGTSKYGVGTGVPVTRWMLSTSKPPVGYEFRDPPVLFDAAHFPEFPKGSEPWTYRKIDILQDAFATDFKDPELEMYAQKVCNELKDTISTRIDSTESQSWDDNCLSTVQKSINRDNSVAAIQGSLRMSGLFEFKDETNRFVSLGANAPDTTKLAQSMKVYTMFPQMPDPMPLPTSSSEDLQKEIATRESRMAESGKDPHQDPHGRIFTHKSTSNVSNTIHGVYLTLDATELLQGEAEIPALDLFGKTKVKREWVSLEDLKVMEGQRLGTEDTKSTFISGFIVRQLVKEGVIDIQNPN